MALLLLRTLELLHHPPRASCRREGGGSWRGRQEVFTTLQAGGSLCHMFGGRLPVLLPAASMIQRMQRRRRTSGENSND